jgi:uncharacterized protein YdcH (DUF465 family)
MQQLCIKKLKSARSRLESQAEKHDEITSEI